MHALCMVCTRRLKTYYTRMFSILQTSPDVGVSPMHVKPHSTVHVAEHPSPDTELPSSHPSSPALSPSPHIPEAGSESESKRYMSDTCIHACVHMYVCMVCAQCVANASHMHISIYTFSEDVYGHHTSYCLRSRKGQTDNARTKKYRCRSRCRCRCRCRSVPIDRFERSVRFKFSRFDSNFSWNPVGLIQIFPGTRKW